MISVIESSNNIMPFDYSGFSFFESGFEAMNSVEEMFNDLTTGILLNEFQYYVENGTEIIYEAEDPKLLATDSNKDFVGSAGDKEKGGFKAIIDKFVNIVKTWVAKLLGMLSKVADYVKTQAESLTFRATSARAKMHSSKGALEALDSISNDKYEEIVKKAVGDNYLGLDIASSDIENSWLIDPSIWENPPEVRTPREEYNDYIKGTALNAGYYAKSKVKATVQGAFKFIGKKILSAKRNIEKVGNEKIKRLKAAKPDDMKDMISKYKTAMKVMSARTSALTMGYKTYVSHCIGIVKGCVASSKSATKDAKDQEKKDKETVKG